MIASLPLFHQVTGRKVLVLGEGEAADAKRRLVERAGGVCITDIDQAIAGGVRIAFVALEEDSPARQAADQLRAAGMLVNVVDRPDLCDFTTPSILDRDPLLIAVGTGGASAGLAKHIRLRLERLLPQSLGKLATALFDARPDLRRRWHDGRDRRVALDKAFQEDGPLDPLDPQAHTRIEDWLTHETPLDPAGPITIQLISNDPEDLTLRAARLLGQADAIFYDSGISPAILDRARADAIRKAITSNRAPAVGTEGCTIILHAAKP